MIRNQRRVTRNQRSGKNDRVTNIIFYGIGGQGVLQASEVAGWAALYDGYHVKKTEDFDMEQYGGAVEAHLRFGKKVYSPLVPWGEVDFLVCLNPEEHERLKGMRKAGGVDLLPYVLKAQEVVGEQKLYVNSVVLGALSHYLPIKEFSWIQALEHVLSTKDLTENILFFRKGRDLTKRM
jgi:indolepyruvate ferredoxin oxidoreductase, beta subunit